MELLVGCAQAEFAENLFMRDALATCERCPGSIQRRGRFGRDVFFIHWRESQGARKRLHQHFLGLLSAIRLRGFRHVPIERQSRARLLKKAATLKIHYDMSARRQTRPRWLPG